MALQLQIARLLSCALIGTLPALATAQGWQPPPKPSPGLMPNPSAGKALFASHCAVCHGADLRGSDRGEKRGPPLLHKIYEPSHHSDAAFQMAVRDGTRSHHWNFGDMPPVPGVTPDDVAHITAYVRAEQRRAGIR
ncbi:MAG TPA: cytochrome c [Rhodocyclaceae bacterium]